VAPAASVFKIEYLMHYEGRGWSERSFLIYFYFVSFLCLLVNPIVYNSFSVEPPGMQFNRLSWMPPLFLVREQLKIISCRILLTGARGGAVG
jgi:hypothetical protein